MDLVDASSDTLTDIEGTNNVLVGQRGNDILTCQGLCIGDAGFNTIPAVQTDLPRIEQIYRILDAPGETGFFSKVTSDFGIIFAPQFHVNPSQFATTAYMDSPIDQVFSSTLLQDGSSLLRDQLGISGIPTAGDYILQPIFSLTPGFLEENQRLQGNDSIESFGHSIVVGDNLYGMSPLDLDEVKVLAKLRASLDGLLYGLSIRMSTMEVDLEYSMDRRRLQASAEITVGGDTIVTDASGLSFVTGDCLTLYGRSALGDILPDVGNRRRGRQLSHGEAGVLSADKTLPSSDGDASTDSWRRKLKKKNKKTKVEPPVTPVLRNLTNWLFDLEEVLLTTNLALYEWHTALLLSQLGSTKLSYQQQDPDPLGILQLAGDFITTNGQDVSVGDGAVIFIQSQRPAFPFDAETWKETAYHANDFLEDSGGVVKTREVARDKFLETLIPSEPIKKKDYKFLSQSDVPFTLEAGNDRIEQFGSDLGIGDYGFFGFVQSAAEVSTRGKGKGKSSSAKWEVNEDLQKYVDSIEQLQTRPKRDKRPSLDAFKSLKDILKDADYDEEEIPFYFERYKNDFKAVDPRLFEDELIGQSQYTSFMLGEYFAGVGYGEAGQTFDTLVRSGTTTIGPNFETDVNAYSDNSQEDIFPDVSGAIKYGSDENRDSITGLAAFADGQIGGGSSKKRSKDEEVNVLTLSPARTRRRRHLHAHPDHPDNYNYDAAAELTIDETKKRRVRNNNSKSKKTTHRKLPRGRHVTVESIHDKDGTLNDRHRIARGRARGESRQLSSDDFTPDFQPFLECLQYKHRLIWQLIQDLYNAEDLLDGIKPGIILPETSSDPNRVSTLPSMAQQASSQNGGWQTNNPELFVGAQTASLDAVQAVFPTVVDSTTCQSICVECSCSELVNTCGCQFEESLSVDCGGNVDASAAECASDTIAPLNVPFCQAVCSRFYTPLSTGSNNMCGGCDTLFPPPPPPGTNDPAAAMAMHLDQILLDGEVAATNPSSIQINGRR